MKPILSTSLLLLVLLLIAPAAHASSTGGSTINAASCNLSDVQSALNSVTSSTTLVTIPSGTCSWTGQLNWTVPSGNTNLTIQGNTTVNCTGTAGTSSYSCPATDSTIIQDAYQSNNALMVLNLGGGSTFFRITGLTLEGGAIGNGSYSKYDGVIEIFSGTAKFRFDHNHCNWTTYNYYQTDVCLRTFVGLTEAVADHNLIDNDTINTRYSFGFSQYGAYDDTIGNGDGAFARSTPWGQITGVFYIEANYMNGGVINDLDGGGSMVVRYNTMNDYTVAIQTHGTKSTAGPIRGSRSIEQYHNYMTGNCASCSGSSAVVGTKGAAALIWGNTVNGQPSYRFYQGGDDRNSGDEGETAPPNGWGYCGTTVNGNGVGSDWDGDNPTPGTPTPTGRPCLDGLGRGQDVQALNGANFPNRLNSVTGTVAWSHQYLEPQYLWDNNIGSISPSSYMLINDDSVNNLDYYYDCTAQTATGCNGSFTGSSGTGYGLATNRPSTCTAGPGGTDATSPTGSYGVAYWATDANAGQGELYVCTATNTWTGIYEPYSYPHPLQSGTSTAQTPLAPSNLIGTVLQ